MLMNDKRKKLRWQLPFLILLVIGTIYAIRSPHSNIPFQREEGAIFGTFYLTNLSSLCFFAIFLQI